MKTFPHSTGFTVVLDRGEEVMNSLTQFSRDQGIFAATVTGIGALDNVEVGYFHVHQSKYEMHALHGEYELLSLIGNITLKDNAPLLHAHVVLSGPDLGCIGGHLFSGRVAVTAELQLTPLGSSLHRELDPETGLWLISTQKDTAA